MGVLGRDQSAGAAFKKLNSNRPFQIGDQPADSRLGDVQDLGSGGRGAEFDGGTKGFDLS